MLPIATETFPPFVLSVDDILEKEAIVVLTNLSRLMTENLRNILHTYVVGLTAGLQLCSRGCTTVSSLNVPSPVPYGTRIWTRNWDRASAWHNKLRVRIILRAYPHKQIATYMNPPSTTLFAHRANTIFGSDWRKSTGTWPQTLSTQWKPNIKISAYT